MAIADSVIDQVRDRVDIVELISGYVQLKKAGRSFKALCPFHPEKTPSFTVNPDKQLFYCFGCGEGGNVFSFLIKMERVTFKEAINLLADRLGMTLPAFKGEESSGRSSQEVYTANALAMQYYHQLLATDKIAQQYLRQRGITEEIVQKFHLGFAADQWEGLVSFARDKRISTTVLVRAGLVLEREGGGYYDRFRERLMFPILDLRGRVVGFGGRVLNNEKSPKYLNSPETEVYQKGRQLYGLFLARESVQAKNAVLLVEGYMDLIALYQAGIEFVVATCGTALTVDQIRLLKRFSQRIIVVYDGDQAGEMASLRGLDLLLEQGCQVKLIDLPSGKDPDDFIRMEGVNAFRQKIQQAKDLLEYKLGVLLRGRDVNDPYQKSEIAKEMLETIHKIASPVLRGEYLKQLSEKIRVREENLVAELNRFSSGRSFEQRRVASKKEVKVSLAEKMLVQLIFEQPDFLEIARRELELSDFENDEVRGVMAILLDPSLKSSQVHSWLENLENTDQARFLSAILSEGEEIADIEKEPKDCIRWFKQNRTKKQLGVLQKEIRTVQGNGDEKVNRLLEEYQQVLKIQQQLSR